LDYLMLLCASHVNASRCNRHLWIFFPFQRITINLAPADIKKEGLVSTCQSRLGILGANGDLAEENSLTLFFVLVVVPRRTCAPNQRRAADSHSRARRADQARHLPDENAKEAAVVPE